MVEHIVSVLPNIVIGGSLGLVGGPTNELGFYMRSTDRGNSLYLWHTENQQFDERLQRGERIVACNGFDEHVAKNLKIVCDFRVRQDLLLMIFGRQVKHPVACYGESSCAFVHPSDLNDKTIYRCADLRRLGGWTNNTCKYWKWRPEDQVFESIGSTIPGLVVQPGRDDISKLFFPVLMLEFRYLLAYNK